MRLRWPKTKIIVRADSGFCRPSVLKRLENPIIRLNVSNLFDRQYFMANAGSGSNVTVVNGGASGAPFYYAGAPRFASLTFQVDY